MLVLVEDILIDIQVCMNFEAKITIGMTAKLSIIKKLCIYNLYYFNFHWTKVPGV